MNIILKRELIKLGISIIFTFLYLDYYINGLLRNSIIDTISLTIIGTFQLFIGIFQSFTNFGIALIFIVIGYLIFNLLYFIIKLILIKTKQGFDLIKLTSLSLIAILSLLIIHDQLLLNELKDFTKPYERSYSLCGNDSSNIDSTNYMDYQWKRVGQEYFFSDYLINEIIAFDKNKIHVKTSLIKVDRLYFIRLLFNDIIEYELDGIHYYKNSNFDKKSADSVDYFFQIEVKGNKLYYYSNDIY
jgi:hypothetical protein